MAESMTTERLTLRPWTLDDADGALAVYGEEDVARWLSPAMDRVENTAAMRLLLQQWISEDDRASVPTGRWAIERRDDQRLVGGTALLYMPPGGHDLEIAWQLARDEWGNGYATEAGHAVAHWAFDQPSVNEVFAVVRPPNQRGAGTARRVGMEWIGETEKYYGLQLDVYRMRKADLDHSLPGQSTRFSGTDH